MAKIIKNDDQGGDQAEKAGQVVAGRVLVHCYLGEPDDVVELDAELAPSLADLVDITPAAVEYALSLKA